ncbi:uncharacterized protein BDCG_16043 [Blastomyces dermatitidis ER-3]|uniref:Uncharacterized protein n=1 Tax=Ajellomyces dermatitidis (strain ER-3 / ATCC MYA-2586) TaxID=559297 RepID=A0ABX2VQ37_AJEDR|nr:uncharacterized protein BDCG_16043 [Blastomyces dermatitidis ER-3]OAS99257.1 hypothetical protein BDCG_16043 [Blastomyces dermatitidis ER-3]
MNRVFADVAPRISPQLQIGDLPKSRRLVHMARSFHLTICMAIWPGVVVW